MAKAVIPFHKTNWQKWSYATDEEIQFLRETFISFYTPSKENKFQSWMFKFCRNKRSFEINGKKVSRHKFALLCWELGQSIISQTHDPRSLADDFVNGYCMNYYATVVLQRKSVPKYLIREKIEESRDSLESSSGHTVAARVLKKNYTLAPLGGSSFP